MSIVNGVDNALAPQNPLSAHKIYPCTKELPHCAEVVSSKDIVTACSECVADTDCPSVRPHCIHDVGIPGTCKQCTATSECTEGTCFLLDHTCQAQCQTDSDCRDPALVYTAAKRCTSRTCSTKAPCPDFTVCTDDGTCARQTCKSDAECAGGLCVNGICYGNLGSYSFLFSPY
jgi:hypothetical protein